MQDNVDEMVGDVADSLATGVRTLESDADSGEESVVSKLLNLVITEAIHQGAGDIYLEPQENDLRVRFRIDGVCQEVMRSPKKLQAQLISRVKISSGMDIAERRIPQDGRFGVVLDGKAVDFRVAVLPTVRGEMSVMRLLRHDSIMMSLKDLGFMEEPLEAITEALAKPYGAILVTGPTGSGKSTTLYAAINETNDPTTNLITVEDPVEYRLEGLSQVQVHERAGLTFASALALDPAPGPRHGDDRRDPRPRRPPRSRSRRRSPATSCSRRCTPTPRRARSPASPRWASSRSSRPRPSTAWSPSASRAGCARSARRRTCPRRRRSSASTSRSSRATRRRCTRRVGCKKCNMIGYKGRMGIHEVLRMTETLERMAVEHASSDELARQAIADGMIPLRQDGFAKVARGMTSIEEILRVIV